MSTSELRIFIHPSRSVYYAHNAAIFGRVMPFDQHRARKIVVNIDRSYYSDGKQTIFDYKFHT